MQRSSVYVHLQLFFVLLPQEYFLSMYQNRCIRHKTSIFFNIIKIQATVQDIQVPKVQGACAHEHDDSCVRAR